MKNPSIIDITKKNGILFNWHRLFDYFNLLVMIFVSVLADGIHENLVLCPLDEKDYFLYYILRVHPGKKIIFANSVSCVKRLHRLLNLLECNPKLLFADMAQNQRLKNLEK